MYQHLLDERAGAAGLPLTSREEAR
jgi:hypothetical protein